MEVKQITHMLIRKVNGWVDNGDGTFKQKEESVGVDEATANNWMQIRQDQEKHAIVPNFRVEPLNK